MIIKEKFSKYLQEREKEKDRCIITRYRCRNEKEAIIGERTNQKYRICRGAVCRTDLFHILKECDVTKNKMSFDEFIEEEEKGLELMKKIKKLKEEITDVN